MIRRCHQVVQMEQKIYITCCITLEDVTKCKAPFLRIGIVNMEINPLTKGTFCRKGLVYVLILHISHHLYKKKIIHKYVIMTLLGPNKVVQPLYSKHVYHKKSFCNINHIPVH